MTDPLEKVITQKTHTSNLSRRKTIQGLLALGLQTLSSAAHSSSNSIVTSSHHDSSPNKFGSDIPVFLKNFDQRADIWSRRYPCFFSDDNYKVLESLFETILNVNLHSKQKQKVWKGVLVTFSLQPVAVRNDLEQLAYLLSFSLFQMALGKGFNIFQDLDQEEKKALCREWQNSSISLLRQGFQGIHSLVNASYYSDPTSWQRIGYEGPPKFLKPKDLERSK